MKYLLILSILLLSFTFVAADTCNSYCEAEGYESGVCRAGDEDTYEFCESNETIYGTFDQCDAGSFERCCCSGEIEELNETSDAVEEPVEEETQCKLVQLNIEKEDIPIIIFFELLLLVVILALVAVFRGPKSHEFE